VVVEQQDLSSLHRTIPVRDGVELRPLQASDAAEILSALEADPEIRKRVTIASRLFTPADVEAEVKRAETTETFLLRFVIVEQGKVVGMLSFWQDLGYFGYEPAPNTFGFGYFLHPKARGRGLVTDAIVAMMDAAQAELTVDSFIAFCEDDNAASVHVLNKLGLQTTDQTFTEPTTGWTERMYRKEVTHAE